MGDYPTASQVLPVTNWPRDPKVREYLFDIYRTREPKMWVEIGQMKIDLHPNVFQPKSEPYYHWLIGGTISRFGARPQHEGGEFELRVPMGGSMREPVFIIHQIPLMLKRECECCDDGTILDITEEGYVCPNCNHPRLPIRLGSRPEVHGTYAEPCDFCGTSIAYTQGDKENLYCPSCGKSRPRE